MSLQVATSFIMPFGKRMIAQQIYYCNLEYSSFRIMFTFLSGKFSKGHNELKQREEEKSQENSETQSHKHKHRDRDDSSRSGKYDKNSHHRDREDSRIDAPRMIIVMMMMMIMIDMIAKRDTTVISIGTDINIRRKINQRMWMMIIVNEGRMLTTGIVMEIGITIETGRRLTGGERGEMRTGLQNIERIMIDKGT